MKCVLLGSLRAASRSFLSASTTDMSPQDAWPTTRHADTPAEDIAMGQSSAAKLSTELCSKSRPEASSRDVTAPQESG